MAPFGGKLKRGSLSLRLSSVVVLIAVGALALSAWPETYPPKGMCSVGRFPDMAALYAREQEGWIGMDPENSYFPIWVEAHPEDTALAEAFMAGSLPERFDAAALPAGAEILAAEYRPLRADVTVASASAFRARWLGLYYPGWQVSIDGDRVAVAPEDDTGLMVFGVPAGEHEIRVRFGTTPMRSAGTGLTVLGMLLAVGTWAIPALRPSATTRSASAARETVKAAAPRASRSGLAWAVLALAAGLLVARGAVVGRISTPVQRSRVGDGGLPEVTHVLNRRFDSGMTLLGFTLGTEAVPSDGELAVDLLWRAYETPTVNARTSVLLRSPDGVVWSPSGTARPRGYEPMPPTSGWRPGTYAYDGHVVVPFEGTPPGVYDVVVAIFDQDTLIPLSPLSVEGGPMGSDLVIGTVQIAAPKVPLSRARIIGTFPGMPACVLPRVGSLTLLEMTLDRKTGVPGDLLAVRWVWEALETPPDAYDARLTLVTPDGTVAREWVLAPAAAWWPTDRWTAGDVWVGRHVLRLPGDLESGVYELLVTADGCEGVQGHMPLEILAPARAWTLPDGLTPDTVVFGDRIALAGHALAPETPARGDELEVHLAWRSLVPLEASYRVYLHIVDAAGTLVAQSDGEPAGWTRPTTGWAVGEFVSDVRRVQIPTDAAAGLYEVRAGLYELDGTRLVATDGEDGALVATIEIR